MIQPQRQGNLALLIPVSAGMTVSLVRATDEVYALAEIGTMSDIKYEIVTIGWRIAKIQLWVGEKLNQL